MPHRRAIVLSVEGLTPASLEPYGCSWLSTSAICQLAGESLVFDRFISDSVRPADVLSSLWSGEHSAIGRRTADIFGRWPAILVTDRAEIVESEVVASFDSQVVVPFSPPPHPCMDVEETALADLFATFTETLTSEPHDLHWCHVSSLPRCWDAPRAMCHQDDEFALPESTNSIRHDIPDQLDPDDKLMWMSLYGGQVRTLDSLLSVLLESINARGDGSDTLLIVVGVSGFSLGEQGYFGYDLGPATSPRTHLPLLITIVGDDEAIEDPIRSSRICQPHQLGRTIRYWLDSATGSDDLLAERGPATWASSSSQEWAVVMDGPELVSFVTPSWLCHHDNDRYELFRKPDDRYDINDISQRAGEMSRLLAEHAQLAVQSLQKAGRRHTLPEEILSGEW